METVKKYEVMSEQLFHVNWEQYLNILDRSKAYVLVEEYTASLGYGSLPDMSEEAIEDVAHYQSRCIVVNNLDKPSEVFKKQLMAQLTDTGNPVKEYSDLQLAVEESYVECLENFGLPSVVVDLGDGEYMVAPVTKEEITIRLLSPVQGCLIIFKPRMFSRFRIKQGA